MICLYSRDQERENDTLVIKLGRSLWMICCFQDDKKISIKEAHGYSWAGRLSNSISCFSPF